MVSWRVRMLYQYSLLTDVLEICRFQLVLPLDARVSRTTSRMVMSFGLVRAAAFSAPGIAGDDPDMVDLDYGREEGNASDTVSEVDSTDDTSVVAVANDISEVDTVELDDVLGDGSNILDILSSEINPLDEDDQDGVLWYGHAVNYLEHTVEN